MYSLTLVSISLCLAFLNTIIIHLIKTKFPKYYFSLGQLVVTDQEDISFPGLLTKFCPPVFMSIFIGFFFNLQGMEITILFGFFSSFLVIWPVILNGDELLSWEAKKKIKVLYLIYFFNSYYSEIRLRRKRAGTCHLRPRTLSVKSVLFIVS